MFPRLAAPLIAGLLLALPASAQKLVAPDHAALREDSLVVLESQFDAFRVAASELAAASQAYCDDGLAQDAYLESFRRTWLAWAPLDAYQFGPIEQQGAALTVAFWPDKKDFVGRGLKLLLQQPPETLRDAAAIAEHSAAVQGLPAIERLLLSDLETCPAVIGISAHLERTANSLHDAWFLPGGYSDLVRSAGPENPVFLSDAEFTKILYTAIDFELTRISETRLGRPLGSFDKPRPRQAEAWRSGLSLDIIDAQLAGIDLLLNEGFGNHLFSPNKSWVRGVIEDTRERVDRMGLPLDVAVSEPATRVRAEALQTKVRHLQLQFAQDVGPELGVETGFSAADGD